MPWSHEPNEERELSVSRDLARAVLLAKHSSARSQAHLSVHDKSCRSGLYDEETISAFTDLAVAQVLARSQINAEHAHSSTPAFEPLTTFSSILSLSPDVMFPPDLPSGSMSYLSHLSSPSVSPVLPSPHLSKPEPSPDNSSFSASTAIPGFWSALVSQHDLSAHLDVSVLAPSRGIQSRLMSHTHTHISATLPRPKLVAASLQSPPVVVPIF